MDTYSQAIINIIITIKIIKVRINVELKDIGKKVVIKIIISIMAIIQETIII